MDNKKIVIYLHKTRQSYYETCLTSVKNLQCPEGYSIDIVTLSHQAAYAAQLNQHAAELPAKYRIYVNDDIYLLEPNLLSHLLQLFHDETIGMIGAFGSQSLPGSGSLMDSPYKYGSLYIPVESKFKKAVFRGTEPHAPIAEVRYLWPSLFATQYNLVWPENYTYQYYTVLDQCNQFTQQQKRLIVPLLPEPWLAYQTQTMNFAATPEDRRRFFQTYHPYLTEQTSDANQNCLYECGQGTDVQGWRNFSYPEGIAIGNHTHIHQTALCRLVFPNFDGQPRLILGEGCVLGAYSTIAATQKIVLDNFVTVSENVHIRDDASGDNLIGLSPTEWPMPTENSEIHIETGVRIEENVVIKGKVHIGRNSIISANSVVTSDIPAYCMVAGNPAHIIKVFSSKEGRWLPIAQEAEGLRLLKDREKNAPLLTYAIITYNRSQYLVKSLRSVLRQVGNDPLVEVLVSDNASTDNTKPIVENLQKSYNNLHYHRNAVNIGGEANRHVAVQKSTGEYVVTAGDDDYLRGNVLYLILNMIYRHRKSAIFAILHNTIPLQIYKGYGALDYVDKMGIAMTWISSIIMRRDLYQRISDPEKYNDTYLPQVYIQLELLKKNPEFTILRGNFFDEGTGEHTPYGYNFAELFIKNYFDILEATIEIPPRQLSQEKNRVMEKMILPWCKKITREHVDLSLEGLFDIVQQYYGREPYYPQTVEKLKQILSEPSQHTPRK